MEIKTYGREWLEQNLVYQQNNIPILSVPHLDFIDGFGLFRNAYRSLTGIYFVPSNLPLTERTRLSNIFVTTLGLHGASFDEMIKTISLASQVMEQGKIMGICGSTTQRELLQVDRTPIFVVAFALGFTGDLAQQNTSAGFLKFNATFGCRNCNILTKNMGNLDFDIIHDGLYHFPTVFDRQKASDMTKTRALAYTRARGMHLTQSAIQQYLSPSVDLCRMFVHDAAHSEWQGLLRNAVDVLFEHAIQPSLLHSLANAFHAYELPTGWGKIQNPIRHRNSWGLQEQGRVCTMLPLILRIWLKTTYLREEIVECLQTKFVVDIDDGLTPADTFTSIFATFAHASSLIISSSRPDIATLQSAIIKGRQMFQTLARITSDTNSLRENRIKLHRERADANATSRKRVTKKPKQPIRHQNTTATVITGGIKNDTHFDAPSRPQHDSDSESDNNSDFGTCATQSTHCNLSKESVAKMGNRLHMGLHMTSYAGWYATMWNLNVLILEHKHKTFKADILHTNTREPELQLLQKENVRKTIRFLLGCAYQQDYPWIIQVIGDIEKKLIKLSYLTTFHANFIRIDAPHYSIRFSPPPINRLCQLLQARLRFYRP